MRARKRVTLLLGAVLTVLLAALALAGGNTLRDRDLPQLTEQAFADITLAFTCSESYGLYDDIYFFDSMAGLVCLNKGETALIIRVYKTRYSPYKVIEDWEPLLTGGTAALVTDYWFAVGARGDLDRLGKLYDIGSGEVSTTHKVMEATSSENFLSMCVVATSTLLEAKLSGLGFETTGEYESAFPGILSLVDMLARSGRGVVLTGGSPGDPPFDESFSAFGPAMKEYCHSLPSDHSEV